MKMNHRPSRVAFLDFETQSYVDLRNSTARLYAQHPSTRALTCCVKVDSEMHRLGPYVDSDGKRFLENVARTHTLVAHNAYFDAMVWEHTLGLPDVEWFDTLPCARAAGFPGGLDKLSLAMGSRGKDKNGKRLIDLLCILKPGRPVPVVGPAHGLLMDYNVQDVEELETIYHRVKGFGEPEVIAADRSINNRGVPMDRSFLEALVSMHAANKKRAAAEMKDVAGDMNPNSPKQVIEWMKKRGFDVGDSVNKAALKNFMEDPESFFVGDSDMDGPFAAVVEMLDLRRDITRVGESKAVNALSLMEPDGRLRDLLIYWKAHTGRWSSRSVQMHNLPAAIRNLRVLDVEPTLESVEAAVAAANASAKPGAVKLRVSDALNVMLRHAVRCGMSVADYGAVEARCLAWMCDQPTMLNVFSHPDKSIYLDMGEKVFGRRVSKKDEPQEYMFAKSLVLGCGYGMSGSKFEALCKLRRIESSTFKAMGMKVSDAVKMYRQAYPEIPQLWRDVHRAIHDTVGLGVETYAGKCFYRLCGSDMHCVLPSGRILVYRNSRIEMRVPAYCLMYGMPEEPVPTVVFDKPNGATGYLYGSRAVENSDQAICRDLLADALVRCEADGLRPFLHVHDEVVCETEQLERMLEIMTTPPVWAKGFPVLAEGYVGGVWTKESGAFKNAAMLNGRVVG